MPRAFPERYVPRALPPRPRDARSAAARADFRRSNFFLRGISTARPARGSADAATRRQMSTRCAPRRVLVISYEFDTQSFSGNGVLAVGLVRALRENNCDVFVACATPDPARAGVHERIIRALVPAAGWYRLDARSAHDAFADALEDASCGSAVRSFAPEATIGVDFASARAARALDARGRFLWTPFRCFSRGEDALRATHEALEREAVGMAFCVMALCSSDRTWIAERLGGGRVVARPPPLRADAEAVARTRGGGRHGVGGRRYLACVVRPSEEKAPHRFVAVCEELERRGTFARLGVAPLLCVNASVRSAYASDLRARFEACAANARVVDSFVGPEELGDIFEETVLNVHPPSHDSFGMTVVEAGAFGAPSAIHFAGDVGARDFLGDECCVCVDMEASARELADVIEELLVDRRRLGEVGERAMQRALEWNETAFGKAVYDILFGEDNSES